jgi:hypothetical protein
MSSLYQRGIDHPVARQFKGIWGDFWGAAASLLRVRARKLSTNTVFLARDNVLEVALGLMYLSPLSLPVHVSHTGIPESPMASRMS